MGGPYSYQTGIMKTFHAWDYVVFALTLGISAAIGLFYAIKDRNRQTTEEYLLGGRRMHYFPVAMSLLSSFISAITILGTPAEVYVNNTMYWWISVAFVITALGAAHIYIPVFYRLGITSVFQESKDCAAPFPVKQEALAYSYPGTQLGKSIVAVYVEMRFGRFTRVCASVIYIIWMLLYMAIVLYGPSLALNAVTGLSLWGSMIAVGLVCTFYTTLGGMKAVLWADTVQMTIVFAGMAAVLIEGFRVLGGFHRTWNTADKNGRIVIFEFDPDPRTRHTVWNVVIGGGIYWCAIFGTNQAQVQRVMAVSSVRKSKIALWLNLPGMAAVITLACLTGVVLYAFYAECDPVKFGLIKKYDQLLPLLVMDLLGDMHGLPGLLLSCIFSGSLSSISSGLNALSAVTLEDFVKPCCCRNISQRPATILSKFFVIVYGLLSLALAFLVSLMSTLILQLGYTLFGVFGGPILGMFTLGMLFPWANKAGGAIGLLASVVFMLWIGIGTVVNKVTTTTKPPVYTTACNYNLSWISTPSTTTMANNISTAPAISLYDSYSGVDNLYTISYIWYSSLGVVSCVVFGLIASLLTGPTKPSLLDPRLICPVFDVFFPWLPETIRKKLRFGVRHEEAWKEDEKDMELDKEVLSSLSKVTEFRDGDTAGDTEETEHNGLLLEKETGLQDLNGPV